jgi:hypothetical protein
MATSSRQVCTDEIRAALLEIQDGGCPCCGRVLADLLAKDGTSLADVEHNPETGRLRGIVCRRDNMRLRFIDAGSNFRHYENLVSLMEYIAHPPADRLPERLRDSGLSERGITASAYLGSELARRLRTHSMETGRPVTRINDAMQYSFARQDAIADLERVLAASGTDIVEFAAVIAREAGE